MFFLVFLVPSTCWNQLNKKYYWRYIRPLEGRNLIHCGMEQEKKRELKISNIDHRSASLFFFMFVWVVLFFAWFDDLYIVSEYV